MISNHRGFAPNPYTTTTSAPKVTDSVDKAKHDARNAEAKRCDAIVSPVTTDAQKGTTQAKLNSGKVPW